MDEGHAAFCRTQQSQWRRSCGMIAVVVRRFTRPLLYVTESGSDYMCSIEDERRPKGIENTNELVTNCLGRIWSGSLHHQKVNSTWVWKPFSRYGHPRPIVPMMRSTCGASMIPLRMKRFSSISQDHWSMIRIERVVSLVNHSIGGG